MASKIRIMFKQSDWDSIPSSHWKPYTGAPANVLKLNGYVLCTLQNLVQDKVDLFRNLEGAVVYEDIESLLKFKKQNPLVWGESESE